MTTVTIGVASLDEVFGRAATAFRGEPQGAHISFDSYAALHKTLSPRRMEILQVMVGRGPMTVRAIAERVGRDLHRVQDDVKALQLAGLLDKDARGQAVFPYDAVHVDYRTETA